jgi:hypothetical protein
MVCCLTLAIGGAILAARGQSGAPSAPSAGPKLAEEQFKNIQALKGTPAEQLQPTMQFIAASLGVTCEYCHVQGANEKDDKRTKITAREMIQMTMAINKTSFEGKKEITCYSCHHGATHPVGIPPVGEQAKNEGEGTKPVDPQAAAATADQILDKYISALGGAEAIQKITSRVEKGTLSGFGGQAMPIEVYAKAPDKRMSVMHMGPNESTTAYDGQAGWLGFGVGPIHMMTGQENEAAKIDADLYFPLHIKAKFSRLFVLPGENIDGHETRMLVGRTAGQPPLRLFFDAQSGLLLRLVRYAETPLGLNPTQIDYADYRAADGVQVPFRWTLSRPGNHFTIQIQDVQQNVPVDDSKFSAPAK